MKRQKTHFGILFTSTLGRGETPTTPAQRACTSVLNINKILSSSTNNRQHTSTKQNAESGYPTTWVWQKWGFYY
ncbi:MAG: hypothetical protein IPG85_08170 [Bacteroidetes bacterium]|nr:hypothetical protein [Bacteroidota bacterium]